MLCVWQPFEVQYTNAAVQSVTVHSSSLHRKVAGVYVSVDLGHSDQGNAGSGDN